MTSNLADSRLIVIFGQYFPSFLAMSTLALLMSPIYGKSFKLFRRHVAPPSSLAGLLASISLSNQKVDIARTSEPGWYGPRSWWPACCLVVALALVPVWIDCLSCFSLGTGWAQSPSSAPFLPHSSHASRATSQLEKKDEPTSKGRFHY
jgi:hypothetical protein